MDDSVVEVDKVKAQLARYALTTKGPVTRKNAQVFGLGVNSTEDGNHRWTRDAALRIIGDSVTKKNFFHCLGS